MFFPSGMYYHITLFICLRVAEPYNYLINFGNF